MKYKYRYEPKEGFEVWLVSEYGGHLYELIDTVDTEDEARALVQALYEKAGAR